MKSVASLGPRRAKTIRSAARHELDEHANARTLRNRAKVRGIERSGPSIWRRKFPCNNITEKPRPSELAPLSIGSIAGFTAICPKHRSIGIGSERIVLK